MNPLYNVTYSDAQRAWRDKAHEIAVKYLLPQALKHDKDASFNEEAFQAAADAGMLGVWIPEEYGGSNDGILALALMVEEFSKADPAFGVAFAVNALGSLPIIVGGTHEQKAKYLPLVAQGKAACAFALSEKFAGSDAGGLSVRATEEADGSWTLRGEKKWTTNGSRANIITCFAVSDPESRSRRISAFIVEDTDPGFSIKKMEDKMGIRSVPVCETAYDGIKLPADRLLGGKPGLGFKHSMMTLDLARPGVAAQAVGTAAGALELATTYATRRKQFGQPISGFQMIQAMLADMAQETEAARALVHVCASMADQGAPNVTKVAAMAKCYATDVAVKVATDAVQVFGGYGFMEDYPIAKFYRDAKILQIYEGTNQVQRMVIARNLIKEAGNHDYLNSVIPDETQESYGAEPVTANV
ncbi:MAG: acyl-CoA dehydrogenase family protein [Planctomycetota bacterium]|jgi:butyryl-CoA dehydrogenase